jgi:acyl-CoA synthetase (NDP forming)
VSIVSISGGTGVLMADVREAEGLQLPELLADVRQRLAAFLPPFASTRNPVDVTGAILDCPDSFASVLIECMEDPGTDVLAVSIGNISEREQVLTDAILKAAAQGTKPIVVTWFGASVLSARRLSQVGIPTFGDPSRAVKTLALTVSRSSSKDHLLGRPHIRDTPR